MFIIPFKTKWLTKNFDLYGFEGFTTACLDYNNGVRLKMKIKIDTTINFPLEVEKLDKGIS